MFSSKGFIVSSLTFRSLILFEFIFVYGVRKCSNFILFSLFCSAAVSSTILSSRSLIYSSASVILLLIPCREFLISFIVSFTIVCSLFSSSWSLFVFSPFYFQDFRSSLLSLLCILFQVDCLFPLYLFGLVCFYLAPSCAAYFSVFSFS